MIRGLLGVILVEYKSEKELVEKLKEVSGNDEPH